MSLSPNPLLSIHGVPAFDLIKAEHVSPAMEQLIAACEAALERATGPDMPADYDALSETLDVPVQALNDSWGVVSHLMSVCNTPELREAFAASQPKVTSFFTRMASDLRLFDLYKRIEAESSSSLSSAQRKALENTLLSFRLAGADLPDDQKDRFSATQMRSAELSREFSNHIQDATDAFVYWAKAGELDGVPIDALKSMKATAKADGRHDDAYKVTLQAPCLGPVMQYGHNRKLRETLYKAQVTRASEFGPAELDNGPIMKEILALRQERAALLGYGNHADVSLVTKMAESPAVVQTFLRDLSDRSRTRAKRELEELRSFAASELGLPDLQAWDVSYAGEKLRQARYAFSDQEVKSYFRLDKVLAGLFEIAERLFDVRITIEQQPKWHEDVTAYRVDRQGELVGRFLLDPYARAAKQAGAWMNGALPRWRKPNGDVREGVAYLVTNFAPPVEGKPAQMKHSDVVTLFHEFGHGLHFLLSTVDVLGVSGVDGVEWDAIELPSQLMENFAWDWQILQQLSAHGETSAPLPRELFDKMRSAKNFQVGLGVLRQIELGLFDMRAHGESERADSLQHLIEEVRAEVSLLELPAYNRFANSFSHIFAGGYAAGYYSYLWAEVLSADAWEVFATAGVLDAATGARYRSSVLERGGSRPMADNFEEFVGRSPRIDSLLRQRGLACEA